MKNRRNIVEQKYPPENPNDIWMKDNVLYKSTHKGWTPLTSGGNSSNIVPIAWQKLKDLRDSSKLIPGLKYRITDYQCTTTQENTRSAGHQFDIVLLALSEDKLAEEGWAMEHPTDVYDVTFSDGVTKKCYLYYEETSELYNLVDIETLLGVQVNLNSAIEGGAINIDHQNKTILILPEAEATSDILAEENLTYNYFQNSNLSAWKVWYCLDNDKSRFAWADDSVDESTEESIYVSGYYSGIFIRNSQLDTATEYCWTKTEGGNTYNIYTSSPTPTSGDKYATSPMKKPAKTDIINSYTPAHEGTNLLNGRGVIYRLIDEWNNDVPYDFKNILIYNETYSQYCYATIDVSNDLNEDPTLDGTKVKAIHVLCDNNDVLKPIAKGGFGNNPLVNIIFLNNSILADEYSNCVVSNGLPIVS